MFKSYFVVYCFFPFAPLPGQGEKKKKKPSHIDGIDWIAWSKKMHILLNFSFQSLNSFFRIETRLTFNIQNKTKKKKTMKTKGLNLFLREKLEIFLIQFFFPRRLKRTTDMMFGGKQVVVCGYGEVRFSLSVIRNLKCILQKYTRIFHFCGHQTTFIYHFKWEKSNFRSLWLKYNLSFSLCIFAIFSLS